MNSTLKYAKTQNVEISALCDVWRINLEKAVATLASKQTTKPMTFSRYGDLLDLDETDAVIIATPDFAHAPILIDAIQAGRDAYVEKQMATEFDHAKEALRLAKEKETVVQVGTQLRSSPRYILGAELVQSGVLGKITHVETNYHHNYAHWARDISDVRREDVDWDQYLMYLPKEPFRPERFRRWHLFKDMSCGTPGLLGSHYMDVATWYMQDPLPASAVANGGVLLWKDGRGIADTQCCTIMYPKEFIVTFCCRFGNKYPVPHTRFYGTRGTFDDETWTATGEGGGKGALRIHQFVPPPVKNEREMDDHHILNWLESLRSRETPNAPVDAGYAHSVAAIMCLRSLETGKQQTYDPDKMEIRDV
jgi:predicted dehydrogenase